MQPDHFVTSPQDGWFKIVASVNKASETQTLQQRGLLTNSKSMFSSKLGVWASDQALATHDLPKEHLSSPLAVGCRLPSLGVRVRAAKNGEEPHDTPGQSDGGALFYHDVTHAPPPARYVQLTSPQNAHSILHVRCALLFTQFALFSVSVPSTYSPNMRRRAPYDFRTWVHSSPW